MTLLAVAIACTCFAAGYPTVIYDSWAFYYLSRFLRTDGLLAWPTEIRTYGYPFFVALITAFRDLPPEEVRLIAFGVQLPALLLTGYSVSRKLARILGSPSAGIRAYAITALNPVLLIHSTELLSDLMSGVWIQLALFFAWKLPDPEPRSGATVWRPFLSFFCAGAAMAFRPANAVVVVALALIWALRLVRWRQRILSTAFAALIGLIPPLLPQALINQRLVGKLSPLAVSDVYRQQRLWGMGALKYGTVVMPNHSPFLVYVNPLYRNDPGPRAFLRNHPVDYLATLALHAFAMVDPDLPFTYVTDFEPWYRWPLSIATYGLLYLALLGCVGGVARVVRRRRLDEEGFVVVSTVAVGAAYLLLYLPVEVEGRFGLPLLLLMAPLAVLGIRGLVAPDPDPDRSRLGSRALALLGAVVFVVGCVRLSAWISTKRTNPFVPSPANAEVLDPPHGRPTEAPAAPTRRP